MYRRLVVQAQLTMFFRINKYPMKDANKAIVDMEEGKARYRISLCN